MCAPPVFIVNPRSAGGETGRTWDATLRPRILAAFPGARWAFTGGPHHAATLAWQARQDGASLIVAVGGDGTVNEVVNGLEGELVAGGQPTALSSHASQAGSTPAPPGPALGIIPRGTGCDFVKSLRIPKDLDGALEVLRAARTIVADLCQLRFAGDEGREVVRYSMNMCGCGASGEVARRVNQAGRPQHGFVAFLLASLRAAVAYRPRDVEIAVDGEPPRTVRLKTLFVCNGEFCGGGMRVGRGAALDDGRLRVVEVGKVNAARSLFHAYRLYTGKLEGVKGVTVYDARALRVTSRHPVLVDCDGEQPGKLPVTYTVRPAALRVLAGAPGRR